jgi:hypothetical protein
MAATRPHLEVTGVAMLSVAARTWGWPAGEPS